jgi:DNA-binding NarL/FixJ family response regulator
MSGMDTNLLETTTVEGARQGHQTIPRIYLTAREIDVVHLVVRGQSNAQIAEQLGIQLQTVKNLLSALYGKLGVATRLQLAVLALRTGFDPS